MLVLALVLVLAPVVCLVIILISPRSDGPFFVVALSYLDSLVLQSSDTSPVHPCSLLNASLVLQSC